MWYAIGQRPECRVQWCLPCEAAFVCCSLHSRCKHANREGTGPRLYDVAPQAKPTFVAYSVFIKPGTHWRQSWIKHGRLCWKVDRVALAPYTLATELTATRCRIHVVADLLPKPATKSTVLATVDFVADLSPFPPFRQQSTLSPVCTGLYLDCIVCQQQLCS